MNDKSFTMELSIKATLIRWLESVVVVFLVVVTGSFIRGRGNPFEDLFSVLFFVVATICWFVYDSQWSIQVSEDEIHLKTIFSKRSLAFSKINDVELNFSKKKLLLSTKVMSESPMSIPVSSTNYDKLVGRLKELDIKGIDKIEV